MQVRYVWSMNWIDSAPVSHSIFFLCSWSSCLKHRLCIHSICAKSLTHTLWFRVTLTSWLACSCAFCGSTFGFTTGFNWISIKLSSATISRLNDGRRKFNFDGFASVSWWFFWVFFFFFVFSEKSKSIDARNRTVFDIRSESWNARGNVFCGVNVWYGVYVECGRSAMVKIQTLKIQFDR